MKIFVILLMLLWSVGYVIALLKIAKSKKRIPFLSVVAMLLFPFLWIFFIKQLSHIESVLKFNQKRHI